MLFGERTQGGTRKARRCCPASAVRVNTLSVARFVLSNLHLRSSFALRRGKKHRTTSKQTQAKRSRAPPPGTSPRLSRIPEFLGRAHALPALRTHPDFSASTPLNCSAWHTSITHRSCSPLTQSYAKQPCKEQRVALIIRAKKWPAFSRSGFWPRARALPVFASCSPTAPLLARPRDPNSASDSPHPSLTATLHTPLLHPIHHSLSLSLLFTFILLQSRTRRPSAKSLASPLVCAPETLSHRSRPPSSLSFSPQHPPSLAARAHAHTRHETINYTIYVKSSCRRCSCPRTGSLFCQRAGIAVPQPAGQ